MRAFMVLLALVATPLVAAISQDHTTSARNDNDAVRHSNVRGGDVARDDDGEKCDKTHPAARGGSARSFEVRQDALHRQDAQHRRDAKGDEGCVVGDPPPQDRKSTRLKSSHSQISYAVFCLKKKTSRTTCTARGRH